MASTNGSTAGRQKLVSFLTTLATWPFVYLLAAYDDEDAAGSGGSLSDLAEGQALLTLEHWCSLEVFPSIWAELVARYRELLAGYLSHPELPRVVKYLSTFLVDETSLRQESIDDVVIAHVQEGVSRLRRLRSSRPHDVVASLLVHLAQAVKPNVAFLVGKLQQPYTLYRRTTFRESFNFLFVLARLWFLAVGNVLRLISAGQRLVGLFLGVLASALTFLPPLAIAFSVLSAVFQTLSIATGSFSSAAFTVAQWMGYSEQRVTAVVMRVRGGTPPMKITIQDMDDWEDFASNHLSRTTFSKNRPDVPHLKNDDALVRCYDLGLVDGCGRPLVNSVEQVLASRPFQDKGFFSLLPRRQQEVAAVLLMRLVALKHVGIVMREGGIKYAVISGSNPTGRRALFEELTTNRSLAKAPHNGKAPLPLAAALIQDSVATYALDLQASGAIENGADTPKEKKSKSAALPNLSPGVYSCLIHVIFPSQRAADSAEDVCLMEQSISSQRPVLLCLDGEADARQLEAAKSEWERALQALVKKHGGQAWMVAVAATDFRQPENSEVMRVGQVRSWIQHHATSRILA